ncbi:MAG TPA: branched-chain amino acid ABC transporter permease, partial [Planctomycetota bacterium]|nr:branched-chain amino acid ABC transporter permease [Planctomycetota bacterium]
MEGIPKIRWEWTFLFLLLIYPFIPFLQDIEGIPLGTQVVSIFIFAILALGLNAVVGYSGLLQLGIAAFFAIGAYITGILTVSDYPFQAGFWIALPLSVIGAGLAGVILGAPTLRLRGDYLAIVTLGFAEVIRYSLINLDEITNSNRALNPVPPPSLSWLASLPEGLIRFSLAAAVLAGLAAAGFILWRRLREFPGQWAAAKAARRFRAWIQFVHHYVGPSAVLGALLWAMVSVLTAASVAIQPEWDSDYRWFYYLIFAILVLLVVILRNLERSRLGRALMAIREDELAASCMGVNPTK